MSLKNAFTNYFGKLMVKTLHLLGRDAGNFPGLVLWTIIKTALRLSRWIALSLLSQAPTARPLLQTISAIFLQAVERR